ncbi:hypothetical protein [Streptomyces sp. NPDC048643]|uniref:hypothetical protein n=1 Tax=Streptomyces sp. NPDC048643 TaxID=3155637 RepID=UPI003421C244
MPIDGESELKIVVLTAAHGSADETRFGPALTTAAHNPAASDGPVTARATP